MAERILVLGGTSFLGMHILRDLEKRGIECLASTRKSEVNAEIKSVKWFQADILQVGVIEALLAQVDPDIVINLISMSSSSDCEAEPQLAWVLNSSFVEHLVSLCEKSGYLLYHLSTDFVFDECKGAPFDEDAYPRASTDLGNTKLMGEVPVIQSPIGRVIRLSTIWGENLLGEGKVSFAWDAYKKLLNKEKVSVFSNVYRTPVLASQVAECINDIALSKIDYPVIHLTEGNLKSNYENFLLIPNIDNSLVSPIEVKRTTTPLELGLKTKYPELSEKLDLKKGIAEWTHPLD